MDRIPGQPPLDDHLKSLCFAIFLKTLQSHMPPDTDELFYCLVRTKDANQSRAKCLVISADSPSPRAGDPGRAEGSAVLPFGWKVEVWWRGGAGLYTGQPEGIKYICK